MNERISLLEGRPFYFKILVLIVLIAFGASLVGGLGYFTVGNIFGLSPDDIANGVNNGGASIPADAMRILQGFFSLGMFFVPALAYSQISKEKEADFFGFNKIVPITVWLAVFILIIALSPFIDGLVYINYHLPYPAFMSELVESLISQQELLSKQMEGLVEMKNFQTFLSNIIIIALIPAIGEEWLFRGVIQKLFKEHYQNTHASIWLTAFFFALLHQSIFYFIGLWLLGALLGYLKEWSGNIWLPVFAHFVNNSLILVITYFFPHLIGDVDEITFEWLPFMASLIISGILVYFIQKELKKTNSKSALVPIEEEDI